MSDSTTNPQVPLTPEQQEAEVADAVWNTIWEAVGVLARMQAGAGPDWMEATLRSTGRSPTRQERFGTAFNAEGNRMLWSFHDVEYLLDQLEELFAEYDDLHSAGADGIAIARHAMRVSNIYEEGWEPSQEEKDDAARGILMSMRCAIWPMTFMENVTDPAVLAAMDAVWDATTPLVAREETGADGAPVP